MTRKNSHFHNRVIISKECYDTWQQNAIIQDIVYKGYLMMWKNACDITMIRKK